MIEGKNITIRAMEPTDIEKIYHWENDPEIWPFSNTTTPFSRFYLEQYIINSHNDIYTDKQLRLIVCDKEENIVGCMDLFEFDPQNRRAGIGILVDKKHRGKGIAAEGLELICEYAQNILNLKQLFCNISEDNTQSMKLFQKAGFEIIGSKKEWIIRGSKTLNEYMLQKIF